MDRTRVVVTGLGVVSPIGNSIPAFEAGLAAGISGVGPITRFDASALSCRIAAEVKDFNPEDYFEKRDVARTDRVPVSYTHLRAHETVLDLVCRLLLEKKKKKKTKKKERRK